jgi:hypothetical protein
LEVRVAGGLDGGLGLGGEEDGVEPGVLDVLLELGVLGVECPLLELVGDMLMGGGEVGVVGCRSARSGLLVGELDGPFIHAPVGGLMMIVSRSVVLLDGCEDRVGVWGEELVEEVRDGTLGENSLTARGWASGL